MPGVSSFTIELARNGLREVLAGPEVEKVLAEKARAVQQAAQARGITVGDDEPLPIEVASRSGSSRSRAVVYIDHPAGLAVEAKHRLLGRALGAARNA